MRGLGDMRPLDALHDVSNRGAGYAILSAKRPIPDTFGVALSDLANICCGQSRSIVVLPAMIVVRAVAGLSAFADLVYGIFLVRAKEEVIRSDAWTIVAFVADKQTVWDRAEMQFPRKAMRGNKRPVYKKALVSATSFCAGAINPAIRSLFHIPPEPFFRQPVASGVRTCATAKACPVGPDIGCLRMILSAAVKAVDRLISHKRNVTQIVPALQDWATV